jgi:hypothetical protein
MAFEKHGRNVLQIEVSQIDGRGLWLCVHDKEYFLPYDEYPWFRDAKVRDILDVGVAHGHHLHWPSLDVDLEIDSLEHPENYPLLYE